MSSELCGDYMKMKTTQKQFGGGYRPDQLWTVIWPKELEIK